MILATVRCADCWRALRTIVPADLPEDWSGTMQSPACRKCYVRSHSRWWADGDAGRTVTFRLPWAAIRPELEAAWATGKARDIPARVPLPTVGEER